MAGLGIRNCIRCKKIFMPVSKEKMCPECRAKELELEEEVKVYVREHPNITVEELIEGTGAPSALVWRMIQQGLFENSTLRNAKYPCGNCGKLITKGVYCYECASKLREDAQKFAKAANSKKRMEESSEGKKTFSSSMYEEIDSRRH